MALLLCSKAPQNLVAPINPLLLLTNVRIRPIWFRWSWCRHLPLAVHLLILAGPSQGHRVTGLSRLVSALLHKVAHLCAGHVRVYSQGMEVCQESWQVHEASRGQLETGTRSLPPQSTGRSKSSDQPCVQGWGKKNPTFSWKKLQRMWYWKDWELGPLFCNQPTTGRLGNLVFSYVATSPAKTPIVILLEGRKGEGILGIIYRLYLRRN